MVTIISAPTTWCHLATPSVHGIAPFAQSVVCIFSPFNKETTGMALQRALLSLELRK